MLEVHNAHESPLIYFALFTLGVFAANDCGPRFVAVSGWAFVIVALIWTIQKRFRRRTTTVSKIESLA